MPPPPAAAAAPPPKRRKRRLWTKVLLVLLIAIVLLVVFAPTLLSTAPARSFAVGKINQNLNGRVEIAGWSLGWASPISVRGIKVFDRSGVQIVELPRLTTELKLLDAARGRLKLGKVTVDGLDVLLRRDAQGNVNLAELLSPSQNAPSTSPSYSGPSAEGKSGGEPTKLPDVSGELHLVNCRATYEDQLQGQTFQFPSIAGQVKFPDINRAIETALEVACKVGDSPAGKISLAGKADVAENNELRIDRADVDEKLTVQGVQLASLSFLLGKDAGIQKLAGMTDATLTLRYKGGESGSAEGSLTSTAVAVGGPALKGDTFSTQTLALVIPPTTLNMAGSDDWKAWALRVGAGATDAITLTIDQGRVDLAADAKVQSLLNLAENLPPGAAGRVRANADLNVGALARQLPKTFALQEGLVLDSGRLTHATDIELAADRAAVRRFETHLSDVRGRNARGPVSLQPIDVTLTAASFGGGFKTPDVRDLALDLKSGFANAQFTGKDVSQIAGSAAGDLKRLRDELGQVVDFGTVQLAGPFAVRIDSRGDVVGGGNSTLHANVTVSDLLVDGIKDTPAIRQKRVVLDATGDVVRASDGSVGGLPAIKLTVNAGDPAQPTVDAQINGSVAFAKSAAGTAPAATAPTSSVASAKFDVAKFVVDLPRAKAEFGPLFPALQEYAVQRGTMSVVGGGTYDGSVLASDTNVALNNLTLEQGAPRTQVLRDETLTVAAKTHGPADFSALTIDSADVKGSVLTANVKSAVLQLKVGQGASARPAGTLEMVQSADLTADVPELAKLQTLSDAFSPPAPAAAPPPAPAAAPAPVRGSNVISRPREPAASAVAAAPVSGEGAPPAPLKWRGGANVKLTVARQDGRVVITPTLTGRNVSVARGAVSESLGDVNVQTALSFVPVTPPAAAPPASGKLATTAPVAPPLTEQMRDLQIPSLVATGAGSTFTLAEPLAISDVAGLQALLASIADPAAANAGAAPATVKTAVRGQGDVGRLHAVMKVIQASDAPASYAGTYALEQRLAGGREGLSFAGTVNVDNFAVNDPAAKPGGAPGGFAEKAIRLSNDIQLDAARHALAVRNVSLDMETTKALQLKLAGNVLDFTTQRRLDNVQGTLGYDWAKLWEIVKPMMSKEQQENLKLRIAGQAQRTFALGGSYPAVGADGKPLAFAQAIKFLTGHFEGGFDVVEVDGITIEKLELPLTLQNGLLAVAYHDRPTGSNLPAAAACNGGKLNIGGATVNLAEEIPRLDLPKGLKLLEGATLNPLFSDKFGQLINNPLFVSSTEAKGLVNITVVECNRLPLDSLVLKSASQNDGRAEFLFSIQDLYLGNSKLLEALKLVGQQSFAQSMQGDIRDSRVIIERGQTRQDLIFNIGEQDRPLRINGSTVLETTAINMDITLPPQLLRQMGQVGREVIKVFPEGWQVPLGGTASAPNLDIQRALANVQKDLVPGLIEGLLNRGKRGKEKPAPSPSPSPDSTTGAARRDDASPPDARPEEPKPADPLGEIFNAIGKKIDEKDKAKEQERIRKQRRNQERRSTDAPPAGSDRISRDPDAPASK